MAADGHGGNPGGGSKNPIVRVKGFQKQDPAALPAFPEPPLKTSGKPSVAAFKSLPTPSEPLVEEVAPPPPEPPVEEAVVAPPQDFSQAPPSGQAPPVETLPPPLNRTEPAGLPKV